MSFYTDSHRQKKDRHPATSNTSNFSNITNTDSNPDGSNVWNTGSMQHTGNIRNTVDSQDNGNITSSGNARNMDNTTDNGTTPNSTTPPNSSPTREPGSMRTSKIEFRRRFFSPLLMFFLIIAVMAVFALPAFMPDTITALSWLPVFIYAIPLAVMVYFLARNRASKSVWISTLFGLFLLLVYTKFLVGIGVIYFNIEKSFVPLFLARYIPLLLWFIIGCAFLGNKWKNPLRRVEYLKFTGELNVCSLAVLPIVALVTGYVVGNVILRLSSLSMTEILGVNQLSAILFSYLPLVCLACFLPMYLINSSEKSRRVLPKIAAGVCFVLMFLRYGYLYLAILAGNYTFSDMVTVWGCLVACVGGISVVIAQRHVGEWQPTRDYLRAAICVAATVLLVVALAKLVIGGITMGIDLNWVVLLGDFVLIFIHLAGMVGRYLKFLQYGGDFSQVQRWVVGYLQVYFIWMVLVSVISPLQFLIH